MIANVDILIIGLYFAAIFIIAWWVTRESRKGEVAGFGSKDYFLGGKSQGWVVIGASLFASNIGSEHLVGLAGSGARGDMPAAQFELLASLILLILGWVFVPLYLKSGVFTMPEFLEKRYSKSARNYLAVISILAYVFTKISITIFAGALVFEVLGVPFWTGATIVVIATGLYTVMGGLKAVLYTDLLQMVILLVGSVAITTYGILELGGVSSFMEQLTMSSTDAGSISHLNLWRSMSDPDFPWTGILFGAPILGVWYWCTDQYIVQRVLAAKNISAARKGTIMGGFLKVLPLFIFVLPGVVAYALSMAPNGMTLEESDQALPFMITQLLPGGLKGLVLAGLLAALMSSLSSVFNSCATLITMDVFKQWRPQTKDKVLVRVGQWATVVLVIISLLWIPFMRTMMEGSGIYTYLQSIQAYISPPIAAVFLFGVFDKRITAKGALSALWGGFILGISRLVLEFLSKEEIISALSGPLEFFVGTNFLHFALFLFIICTIILYAVSLWERSDFERYPEMLYNYVTLRQMPSTRSDFIMSLGLILLIIIVWVVFSPLGVAGM
ncbi:MAG: sodium:solute symporter [Saprospiraceae bacterium]|nr:sodium:solute symporter [Saprospiraceae bacterium]